MRFIPHSISSYLKIARTGFIAAFIAQLGLSACGGSKDSDDDEPAVTYATIELKKSSIVSDDRSVELQTIQSCVKNSDSGLLTLRFDSGSANPASLSIKIKGFKSTPSLYSCVQTANNQNSDTSVGDKFDNCGVSAQVLADGTESKANTYATYRDEVTTKPFDYTGKCSVDVSEVSPTLKGTVQCTKLVQTHFEGAARNPIDEDVVTTLSATFYCTL